METESDPMDDDDIDAADAIAESLDQLLLGKQKSDILRAFGFIISSMCLECSCTNIDDTIDTIRAAAQWHFASANPESFRHGH